MADRTTDERTMTRSELAAYLESIAAEFDRGEETIAVDVGNKTVTLAPPEQVTCEVEVVERSSMLRGERETIDVRLHWKS